MSERDRQHPAAVGAAVLTLAIAIAVSGWRPARTQMVMEAGEAMPVPVQQFFDDNGDPCAGCTLYAFQSGTTTPQATYTSPTRDTPHAHPIVLDAAGRQTVFVDSLTYRFVLTTPAGVTLWSVDGVGPTSALGNALESRGDVVVLLDTNDDDTNSRFSIRDGLGQTVFFVDETGDLTAATLLGTEDLADAAVTGAKLAADAVTSANIENGQVETDDLADDAVTSAKLAADSVGTSQLRTAQGSADGPVGQGGGRRNHTTIELNRYALLPSLTGDCGRSADLRLARSSSSTDAPRAVIEAVASGCPGGTYNMTLYWDYVTSSDNPAVWVVIGGTGDVYATWESEDPTGTDSPFGELDAGQRAVAIGLPSLAQLEALYAALTTEQQAAALDTLRATVVTRRGWLSSLTALSDLSGIETRYEPSGRQWALRALAAALDLSVGAYMVTRMAVDTTTDTWTVRATALTTRPMP